MRPRLTAQLHQIWNLQGVRAKMVRTSCSGACTRWSTFLVGCFIWIGGSGMLGVGIWVKTQDTGYKQLTKNLNVTIGYIAVSSFVFFLGFIGTCSILLLKRKLLKLYFVLLLTLLLAEIAIGTYIYLQQDKMEDYIKKNWNAMDDKTRIWIQNKLQCCSMNPVIISHASSQDRSCFKDKDTPGESRWQDCYSSLVSWMKTNLRMLIISAAVVGAFEIFTMAGVLRIITITESSDRMIRQVSVAPYNGDLPDISRRTQRTTKDERQPSGHSSCSKEVRPTYVPEEAVFTRSDTLECWAKYCPQYNHKL